MSRHAASSDANTVVAHDYAGYGWDITAVADRGTVALWIGADVMVWLGRNNTDRLAHLLLQAGNRASYQVA